MMRQHGGRRNELFGNSLYFVQSFGICGVVYGVAFYSRTDLQGKQCFLFSICDCRLPGSQSGREKVQAKKQCILCERRVCHSFPKLDYIKFDWGASFLP